VSRADPDGRRPMWRQGVRAAWRSLVADRNKVKIGGEPVLPLLGVLGEAKPGHQPGCQAARARSLKATRGSPKPASTRRSMGERLDACSGARGRLDEDEWIAAMSCRARLAVRRR
jgi:hypothetical protein